MITIKLKHNIILLETKLVIKIHQVSFFALTPTRPINVVITFNALREEIRMPLIKHHAFVSSEGSSSASHTSYVWSMS
nr:hypothetical protein a221L - Chlorella virus PBCV-1 [Paramecium bursaria Chlorella virus 1]